ncbi:MAG: hypothetical protein FD126_2455 [Elusimicrobia bacterium]|nr:MAG: hypothetical protein FD126_2455 [Elusimicrobiota bacterium]
MARLCPECYGEVGTPSGAAVDSCPACGACFPAGKALTARPAPAVCVKPVYVEREPEPSPPLSTAFLLFVVAPALGSVLSLPAFSFSENFFLSYYRLLAVLGVLYGLYSLLLRHAFVPGFVTSVALVMVGAARLWVGAGSDEAEVRGALIVCALIGPGLPPAVLMVMGARRRGEAFKSLRKSGHGASLSRRFTGF